MKGFALLEVLFALALTLFVMMILVTMMTTQRKSLDHYKVYSEMQSLMMSAHISADPCKSVRVSGGIPPLAACGTANTPATINVLYSDGTPVETNSTYLLQATCNSLFYSLQIKSANASKVDAFTGKMLGLSWMAPLTVRFAEQAWLVGGCP